MLNRLFTGAAFVFCFIAVMSLSKSLVEISGAYKAIAQQLEASQKQHNAEVSVALMGLRFSQQGDQQRETVKREISKEISAEPCAALYVPDATSQRLWKLAEDTRAAVLPGASGEPDSVSPAPASGR